MNYWCPCGERHVSLADRRECMGEMVAEKQRDRFREAFGLK